MKLVRFFTQHSKINPTAKKLKNYKFSSKHRVTLIFYFSIPNRFKSINFTFLLASARQKPVRERQAHSSYGDMFGLLFVLLNFMLLMQCYALICYTLKIILYYLKYFLANSTFSLKHGTDLAYFYTIIQISRCIFAL